MPVHFIPWHWPATAFLHTSCLAPRRTIQRDEGQKWERGTFKVFDKSTWEVVRKENYILHYDLLQPPVKLQRLMAQDQGAHVQPLLARG